MLRNKSCTRSSCSKASLARLPRGPLLLQTPRGQLPRPQHRRGRGPHQRRLDQRRPPLEDLDLGGQVLPRPRQAQLPRPQLRGGPADQDQEVGRAQGVAGVRRLGLRDADLVAVHEMRLQDHSKKTRRQRRGNVQVPHCLRSLRLHRLPLHQARDPALHHPRPPHPAAKPIEDINIVISSVAGGIGLTVSEYLAKMGYKNIYGIAGSDEKCKVAIEMGCKGAVNYWKYYDGETIRAKDFEGAVRQMMGGQRADIYYENVGEDMLSSLLNCMADHSKVIMCGATATYNNWGSKEGVRNFENIVSKRIQLKGILYFDDRADERIRTFMEMMSLGIDGREIVVHGIDKLPTTYHDMIHGKHIGKPVIQLWDKPIESILDL